MLPSLTFLYDQLIWTFGRKLEHQTVALQLKLVEMVLLGSATGIFLKILKKNNSSHL